MKFQTYIYLNFLMLRNWCLCGVHIDVFAVYNIYIVCHILF